MVLVLQDAAANGDSGLQRHLILNSSAQTWAVVAGGFGAKYRHSSTSDGAFLRIVLLKRWYAQAR